MRLTHREMTVPAKCTEFGVIFMNSSTIAIVLAFVFYLAVMIMVGLYTGRKTTGSADYFLGGRKLSGPVAALSAQASDMSGWLLMGLPGSIYALGTGQAWIAIGLLIGTIINWLVIARPLRAYTIVANNSMTVPEFLTNRYHDEKNLLKGIASVVIMIFFLVYTASALAAGGKLFNSVLGWDYHLSLVVGAVVILTYTLMGGFLAVCTTDFIQGTLMLVGLIAVPLFAYFMVDGSFSDALNSTGVNSAHYMSLLYNGDHPITAVEVISNLAWGLGYCGMPHIIIRFFAIRSEKEVKQSAGIAIAWDVIASFMTLVVAIVGRAFLAPVVLGETAGAAGEESVFIEMIKKVFVENLPLAFIGGLFLCGILAAIMSTADSQLLMCSSSMSQDIYKGLIRKDADDKSILKLGRLTTILIALAAIIIAWDPGSSVMNLVSDAWAGLGASFGPLVVMSLFWKRTNLAGAVAGLVSGAVTVIVWDYLPLISGSTIGNVTGLYSLAVGFAVSIICIVAVSLMTKAPDDSIVKEFEAYKNYKED